MANSSRNPQGFQPHGSKGNRYARGNSLHKKGKFGIDFKGESFLDYARRIDELGGNLEMIFTKVLETVGEMIQTETIAALAPEHLPAKGRYSTGETKASVIENPRVRVSGSILEIPVGFDKTKPGAGGWLITGTPRMAPAGKLAYIFDSKFYVNRVCRWKAEEILQAEIKRLMG